MTRPAAVVFSPLPPMAGLLADQCFGLLAGLAAHRSCLVVVEDGLPERQAPQGVAVISAGTYRKQARRYADALHVYMLGDGPEHIYMLPTMAERPGVVILHNPSLHELLQNATLGRGDIAGYMSALTAEYGGPGRVLAGACTSTWPGEAAIRQDMPMLTGLIGPARLVIVPTRYAAAKVLARVSDAHIKIIPPLYLPPRHLADSAAQTRAEFGIAGDELFLLSLGRVARSRCIDRILSALAGAAAHLPPFRYVIAGASVPAEPDFRHIANRLGIGLRVIMTGPGPAPKTDALIAAADVVLHLRQPPCGKVSAHLTRALGGGACSVVFDHGPYAELPHSVVEKLGWGPGWERRLGAGLTRLAQFPDVRARVGAAAAGFVASENLPERVIEQYRQALDEAETIPARPWRTEAVWAFATADAARPAAGRLWQKTLALPRPAPSVHALCFGTAAAAPGWQFAARPWSDLSHDPPARQADLILVDTDGDALVLHLRAKLRRLNRMLRFGGLIIINVTRAQDGPPGALQCPVEGAKWLEACGFALRDHVADTDPLPGEKSVVEEHCWRAVKMREIFTRTDWRDDDIAGHGSL
jgi:hypothetical protein